MRVLDLFSGLGGATKAFADQGHELVTVDLEERFKPTVHADMLDLSVEDLAAKGPFDFIWASPPCQRFSVMTFAQCWDEKGRPKRGATRIAIALVQHTLYLIEKLEPRGWILENPVGMLRALPFMARNERRTVTYCRYGMPYRKATDLWGGFPPTLRLRPPCSPGSRCHIANPRNVKSGVQAKSNLAGGALAFEYYARHGEPYLRGEAPYIPSTRDKDGMQATSLAWIREVWDELNAPNEEGRRGGTPRSALRALVPYELSMTVCEAMEKWSGGSWKDSTLREWAT